MLDYIIILLLVVVIVLLIILLIRKNNNDSTKTNEKINEINNLIDVKFSNLKEVLDLKNEMMFKEIQTLTHKLNDMSIMLGTKFEDIIKNNYESYNKVKEQLAIEIKDFNKTTNESLNKINDVVNHNLKMLRDENSEKLEKINVAVSEKLEKTLEGRLKQSFDSVIEQIGGVNKAIGEIKGLASDVGSLKSVLTNVKTKGIVGEVILGNIIKDILTVDQYEQNFVTKVGSSERVEFAIKMPALEDEYIYLPIDSKLPLESYHKIKDNMEIGNPDGIKEGRKELKAAIKKYAKDISEKYIDVPNTCDFAIMFLPIEGLYIEVLDMNIFEEIQREFKVNIAGPTTLTAILNSLQMGFKTLVIQKKSADVFKLLGAVKTEFEKFASTLEKTQKKFNEASFELDKLVGTRTRMIQSKLKNIQKLEDGVSSNLIESE